MDISARTVGTPVREEKYNPRYATVPAINLLIGDAASVDAGDAGNTTVRVQLNASFRVNDP